MINRVARNQTIKRIPHLVEQILHLPLPDVAGEVADVDRAAPVPAHPSPLTYQQSKKGRINQQISPRRVRVRIRIYATRHDPPQENKSRRQRGTNHPRNDEERRFLPEQLWPEGDRGRG